MGDCSTEGSLVICKFSSVVYVGNDAHEPMNAIAKGSSINGTLTIPDFFNDEPISVVGQYAFARCASITHIIIGSNIKEIHTYAFGDMHNVKTVFIPASVERIDKDGIMFYNLSSDSFGTSTVQVLFAPNSRLKSFSDNFGHTYKTQVYLPNIIKPVCNGTVMRFNKVKEVISPYSFTFCGVKSKTVCSKAYKRKTNYCALSFVTLIYS